MRRVPLEKTEPSGLVALSTIAANENSGGTVFVRPFPPLYFLRYLNRQLASLAANQH
jgi:hypothetical protein